MDNISPEKLRDVLITKTAIKTLQSERVVEAVIAFQFKDARDQAKVVQEIEISGFGKLYISQAKVRRKIIRLEKLLIALTQKGDEEKINRVIPQLEYLKTRLIQDEN